VVLVDQMGGASSSLTMRLKSAVSIWTPRSPRSFKASTGTSSGPGSLPRSIVRRASATSAPMMCGAGPGTGSAFLIGGCGNSVSTAYYLNFNFTLFSDR